MINAIPFVLATPSKQGAMSAQDKSKLDGYASTPSGLTFTESQVTNLTTDLAARFMSGDIVIEHIDGTTTAYPPASGTAAARGTALRTAFAAAISTDKIWLSPCTFDMGATTHILLPPCVVQGASQYLTKITTAVIQATDSESPFCAQSGTHLMNVWMEMSATSGYQTGISVLSTFSAPITAHFHFCRVTGDSDGFFVFGDNTNQIAFYIRNSEISTKYDAIAMLGSGSKLQTIEIRDTKITSTQPSGTSAHISNCCNIQAGTLLLENCQLTATGDANSVQTTGITTQGAGGFGTSTAIVEVRYCTFNVSSASNALNYDILTDPSSTVKITGGKGTGSGGAFVNYNNTLITYENQGITPVTSPITVTNNSIGISAATGSVRGSQSAAHFTLVNNATDANTASTIVKRDASGNFTATTITAALTGTASGNYSNTATQTAKAFLGGPTSGSAAAATFRAIASADVPARIQLQVQTLSVANGLAYFVVPVSMNGKTLTAVAASVITAGTTNATTVQLTRVRSGSGVSMLSSVLSIASTASDDDGTAAINGTNAGVQTLDRIRLDITGLSTTPPTQLIISIEFV